MADVGSTIFYIFVFISVYVQVFFLVTFFENRKKIVIRTGKVRLKNYPGVTIIVPCWNEEKTLEKTMNSLLAMRYPRNKLKLFIVDDGSKDNTWQVAQKFAKYENVQIFKKENGGKHTALNLGLEHTDTPYVGCLDADSVADKESLVRIMSYFEKDPDSMAVAPSIIVTKPKTLVQKAQKAEYDMAIFVKKMLGLIGAIHVTPGPLTIFKKQVFEDLGPYRHAHNTEDMEIAYRMQKHDYKIEQCNDAYVYTNTPPTVKTLYKQRLRWIYGFINNTIDYRKILFKKRYGNFSTFTVPAGAVSVLAAVYVLATLVYRAGDKLADNILELQLVGFSWPGKYEFDPYFISTESVAFLSIFLYGMIIFSVVKGRHMVKDKKVWSIDLVYFFVLYGIVAPFWLMRAVYNTVIAKKPSWR